jgi:hypothetical protein
MAGKQWECAATIFPFGRGSLLELETQVLLCRRLGELKEAALEVLLREIEHKQTARFFDD